MWLKAEYEQIKPTHFYTLNSVLYAGIPKNSSSKWCNIFRNNHVDVNSVRNPKYAFVIIREPHERLISGITEWIKRSSRTETVQYVLENFDVIAQDKNIIPDINYHAHLMPQHYFTAEHDFDLINFNQQPALAERVSQYRIRATGINANPGKKHPHVDSSLTRNIVQNYYAPDVELWNAVN